MTQTPDTNFAAYLVKHKYDFTIGVDDSTGKRRVIYSFQLTPEEYADLFTAYMNDPLQDFIAAQQRLKRVIRAALN